MTVIDHDVGILRDSEFLHLSDELSCGREHHWNWVGGVSYFLKTEVLCSMSKFFGNYPGMRAVLNISSTFPSRVACSTTGLFSP